MRTGLSAKIPEPLTAEEENEVIKLLGTEDEGQARETLMTHNLRLVYWIVSRSYPEYQDPEELISAGMLGLVKGVHSFDPGRTKNLSAYLGACIRNEIRMYLRKEEAYHRRNPYAASDHSHTAALSAEQDEGMAVFASADSRREPYTETTPASAAYTERDYLDRMSHAVRELSAREQYLLKCRYGMEGLEPVTQREAAERLSLSQSYVSRLERTALAKLRRLIEE